MVSALFIKAKVRDLFYSVSFIVMFPFWFSGILLLHNDIINISPFFDSCCFLSSNEDIFTEHLPSQHHIRFINVMINYFRKKQKAAQISFVYVALATLSVCSVYPKDLFYGQWSLFGLLVTFPVSIISFGYRYADAQNLYPVFIIQLFMFLLTKALLGRFIKN